MTGGRECDRVDWPDPLEADAVDPEAMKLLRETDDVRGRLLRWRRPRLLRAGEWLSARLGPDPPPVGCVADRTVEGRSTEIPVRHYQPPASAPIGVADEPTSGSDDDGTESRTASRADDAATELERDDHETESRPDDPTTDPAGTVVFFHGGGFVLGSIASHDRLCRSLCRTTGCRVVSVGYRRAPEHPFPAAVEDAIDATAWVADRFAGPLVVAGDSAGGNLAAVVAYWAATEDGPEIARQVLAYPGVDQRTDHASRRDHDGLVLSEEILEWFAECYYGSEITLHNPYADPMAAGDLSGVAPATILTAGFDPLRDGGLAYGDRLIAAGVAVSRFHEPDMVHGYLTLPGLDHSPDGLASEIRTAVEDR